jgi:glycosyltransferase involved in cell wall biosynthesis
VTLRSINGGSSQVSGPGKAEPTVSIVIPAKNEALNLPHVFAGLDTDRYEVILVDGNSTDDTVGVARRLCPEIIVVGPTRKGKGNALACGFAEASGDFIVMLDADGSTDPGEIPRFVDALRQGADFAKGSRFMPGAGSSDISRLRQLGNYFLNKWVNLIYGTRYTDLCYGYNAFRRECLSVMDLGVGEASEDGTMLWGDGFEVETLINVRIAKASNTAATTAPAISTRSPTGSGCCGRSMPSASGEPAGQPASRPPHHVISALRGRCCPLWLKRRASPR